MTSNQRTEITESMPFLSDSIGEMRAVHGEEGPVIEVKIEPLEAGQFAEFGLYPAEAYELADQLTRIAKTAQRAGWTPQVLADVRNNYLPDASDEEIMNRLDRLYEHRAGFVLGMRPGTVDRDAGRALIAELAIESLDRMHEVVDRAAEHLGVFEEAGRQITDIRAGLAGLREFYQSETERRS